MRSDPSGRLDPSTTEWVQAQLDRTIDGVPSVGREELRARVPELAAVSARIASTTLPAEHGLPAWRSWVPGRIELPQGAARGLWQAAMEAYRRRSAPVIDRPVLLHRDLHPTNVLWRDGVLAGVVDWVNACVGHPHAELGNGRWNLAVLAGTEAAEAYLERSGGSDYDPFWDLEATLCRADLVGASYWVPIGRADIGAGDVLRASERLLDRALAGRPALATRRARPRGRDRRGRQRRRCP